MVTYNCDRCKKDFYKKDHYNRHFNRKYTCKYAGQIYTCGLCHNTFEGKKIFLKHISKIKCTKKFLITTSKELAIKTLKVCHKRKMLKNIIKLKKMEIELQKMRKLTNNLNTKV